MNQKQKLLQQKMAYEDWKRKRDAKVEQPTPVEEDTDSLSPELEEQRRRNRAKYPEIAEFVDAVRAYFPDAKVVSITPHTPEEAEARRQALANRGSDELVEPDDQQ